MKIRKCLAILLLSAIALGGCAEETTQEVIIELKESALNAPQKTEVVRGDMSVSTYLDAVVGPKVEQLTFEKEGSFGEYLVELGDTVKEGDLLVTPALENVEKAIENQEDAIEGLTRNYEYQKTTMENNLTIAKANLKLALDEVEKLEYTSPNYTAACKTACDYNEQVLYLELQLKQLKETYDLQLPYYQKQLKKLKEERDGNMIRAPFDGTIIALADAEYGNWINTDNYYVAVADSSVTYARSEMVSITVLNNLESIAFWKDGEEYAAVSIPMEHDYFMATKNNGEDAYSEYEISDPDGELSMGDYGKIKLVSRVKTDVLMVPETTLQHSGGKYYVYKDVDGKHERVNVEIGSSDGINVEIVEGLEEGDVVYVQE